MEEKNEVSEVYSVPRVTNVAERMDLKAGWALDICTTDDFATAPLHIQRPIGARGTPI